MSSEQPEPDVAELMRRVREDVERRRLESRMHDGHAPAPDDDGTAASWQAMREAIDAGGNAATVGMRLPPMTQMHGLRRRVAVPMARLILRIAQLVTRDQTAFNHLVLGLVRMLADTVHERLGDVGGKIEALTHGLAQAIAQARTVSELSEAGARLSAEARALRERVAGFEAAASRIDAAVADVDRRLEDVRRLAESRSADAERVRGEHARALAQLERRTIASPAERAVPVTVDRTAGNELSDAFYISFEDRFRGTRDDVKSRVRVYLPTVRDAGAGAAERPVLDLGCGRGEWLELLAEEGLVARGVDLNDAMAEESRARGLDVVRGDALAHLRALAPASVGAVTGMHVIEHLPFGDVVAVFDECARVLAPGGVAIFETPNPKNLVVGACQFYVDPTHRRPLHPDTMAFVAESRGLTRVTILPLHPVEGRRLPDDGTPADAALNEYLFGPQDFAVVGYRD
jgi:O-antigen chain-terminating methyltransferase